jgi:hypothetical protein
MKRILWVVALFAVAAALSSCAKAPQMEFDAANAKIAEARQAEADRYAVPEFNAAMDSLNAAQREIEAQNAKFALFRKYSRARQMIAAADAAALTAKQVGIENKERTKNEADQLIAVAQAAMDTANFILPKAPRGKETKEALELIKSDLLGAQTSLDEAKAAFQRGDYLEAKAKAQAVKTKSESLLGELKAAFEKARRPVPKMPAMAQ